MTGRIRRLEVVRSRLSFHGGGEATHQRELLQALHALGVETVARTLLDDEVARNCDVVHVWNVQDPREALASLRWAKERGLRTVLTPLLGDLQALQRGDRLARAFLESERKELPDLIERLDEGTLIDDLAASDRERQERAEHESPRAHWNGLRAEAFALADTVLCLSSSEATRIQAEFTVPAERIAVTPVGLTSPAPIETRAAQDFVLLPASRIEPLKNQLVAILALRKLPFRLVLTGEPLNRAYGKLCRELAGPYVDFVGVVEPRRLGELLQEARVVLHPSHMECASLCMLEAAAAGASLVASQTGSERDYCGDLPRYVDPCNAPDIAAKVREAWDTVDLERERRAQLAEGAREFTWARAATATADALQQLVGAVVPA